MESTDFIWKIKEISRTRVRGSGACLTSKDLLCFWKWKRSMGWDRKVRFHAQETRGVVGPLTEIHMSRQTDRKRWEVWTWHSWTGHPAVITECILQLWEKLIWEDRMIFLVKATGRNEIRKTKYSKSWAQNPREHWLLRAHEGTGGWDRPRKQWSRRSHGASFQKGKLVNRV